MRPAHFELVDEVLLSLELAPLLLVEGLDGELSLGVLLVLPVLGEAVAPELMLSPLGGAPASLDEDAPPPLAPDAPDELSPDELEPELPLAPALAPPPAAPPAPPP